MKMSFSNESEARVYVRSLRLFYQELRIAAAVFGFFCVIWLFSGAGYFWPVWVALGWGMSLVLRGIRLGVLDAAWLEKVFGLRVQHLTDHWEDQKVEALMKENVLPKQEKKSVEKAVVSDKKTSTKQGKSTQKTK